MTEILLVDDNAIQATTRKVILSRCARRVTVAENGSVALGLLQNETFTSHLALVVTDHLMPGMNGPEFVRQLRKKLPRVPVLVLSGLPDAEEAYEGCDVVFRLKPILPEELIRLVTELVQTAVGRTA